MSEATVKRAGKFALEVEADPLAVNLKPMFEAQARERMAAGGGDRKSGKANLPDPIPNQGEARDQAAAAVGVSGKLVSAAKAIRDRRRCPTNDAETVRRVIAWAGRGANPGAA